MQADETWFKKSPLEFFNIFDDELIKYVTEQTKLFALQSDGGELMLLTSEMKTFLYIGILMKFGIMKPPSIVMCGEIR